MIIAGSAGAEDILTLDGKWMATSMGTASKPTETPDKLDAGRYTIEIHGTSLVSTTQWGAGMTPEIEKDTIEIASTTPGKTLATVTDEKGQKDTWTFTADTTGMTVTFPDLLLHLVPFDEKAAAQTHQDDLDQAPGGPPIQDRPLSGTISGAPWIAAHAIHDAEDDSSTLTCFKISALPPSADGDLDGVANLSVGIPKAAGPFPFTVHPVEHFFFHVPPNETLSSSAVRMIIYSCSERTVVIGVAASFGNHNRISGTFTLDLPVVPKPREHFTLDGKWMVDSIKSTKSGENGTMTPEPGAMTLVINGSSVLTTVIMMPDDSDKPDASTLTITGKSAGKITGTVIDKDGTKETWVVTADDQGLTVTTDDQIMRLVPWDEKVVALFNLRRQDALQPARPISDGALSGLFDGVAWKATSCIRSSFQMKKDAVDCEIAAGPQKPGDFGSSQPTLMISLPKKPGTYPFSGDINATFSTPPGKNAFALKGQLVIYSITDKAITFGLSARADKDHDVTGRITCDLTVPVDSNGPADASDTTKQDDKGK